MSTIFSHMDRVIVPDAYGVQGVVIADATYIDRPPALLVRYLNAWGDPNDKWVSQPDLASVNPPKPADDAVNEKALEPSKPWLPEPPSGGAGVSRGPQRRKGRRGIVGKKRRGTRR